MTLNKDPFNIRGPLRYPAIAYVLIGDFIQNYFWFFTTRITGHTLYHVVGDSHTRLFRGNKWCFVYHLGAATAYNLQNPNSTTKSRQKLWKGTNRIDKKKDKIIMVFGEIDCRIHIYHQFKKRNEKVSINDLIANTIEAYGKTLFELRDKGINVLVFGIAPASHQENIYEYPNYAPPNVRASISKKFNEGLSKFCTKNKFPFYNIYEKTVDSEGFLSKEFAYDEIHINSKAIKFVNTWLRNLETSRLP